MINGIACSLIIGVKIVRTCLIMQKSSRRGHVELGDAAESFAIR